MFVFAGFPLRFVLWPDGATWGRGGPAAGKAGEGRGGEAGKWRCGGRADPSEEEGTQAPRRPRERDAPGAGERGALRWEGKEQWGTGQGSLEGGADDQAGEGEEARGNGEPEGRNVAGLRELQLAGPGAGPHLHL